MNNKEKQYTREEIYKMFEEDKTLSPDFKSEILSRLDATYQAMYNCVKEREQTMVLSDPWGDRWVEEHNRFVTLYQHYDSYPEHYVTLKLKELERENIEKKS
jgi:hypothetical protein